MAYLADHTHQGFGLYNRGNDVVDHECKLFGQYSRPWASDQNRAAMRQLPAAQPLMTVNGRFRHRRGTAPDPEPTVTVFQSGHSPELQATQKRTLPDLMLILASKRPVLDRSSHSADEGGRQSPANC